MKSPMVYSLAILWVSTPQITPMTSTLQWLKKGLIWISNHTLPTLRRNTGTIQQCIIHQIRNTTRFVSYKELKPLMADLKKVYAAPTEKTALSELGSFDEKRSGKYPKIAKSRRDNWANLSTYFKYPEAVRRLIYTTNTIEGFNSYGKRPKPRRYSRPMTAS